ncbi:MAG: DUF3108 domain-containing protein [Thermodesulfobacteriota bacterium]|nr:DUF3108 domain-containing protein [Thermodesulfobacteriota bacterium]
MRKKIEIFLLLFLLSLSDPSFSQELPAAEHPIQSLVGETLAYDVSFLWFDHLAEGSITLTLGEGTGTFLVVMEAKTLGMAAFFTRDRVEKYQTLMKIGASGLLQPLWHSSHTIRGKNNSRSEKITRYTFDYDSAQVRYQKIKNNHAYADELFSMENDKPLFDILSALYNLRLGFYGQAGQETILIPTFHRKGTQDIVVEPLKKIKKKDRKFFAADPVQCRILVDPSVFGTKGRDILTSFDKGMRPQKGIIKNVIGLGDVRGKFRAP